MTATLLEPTPSIATPETEAKLCYVEDNFAYFTTQELSEQWGDDWDDAPYECNAGKPYEDEGWRIIKVAFDAPSLFTANIVGDFSVEQINSGAVAWLHSCHSLKKVISIPAGTTIFEFKGLIWKSGGDIYTHEPGPFS